MFAMATACLLGACVAATPVASDARGPRARPIVGTYPDAHLARIESFTLPRTFLYDRAGRLVPQEEWPSGLDRVKRHAGQAFCCVSDEPSPPGSSEPPEDCKKLVFGTDVLENFEKLVDRSGEPFDYERLPRHAYLIVEYYATWCEPCVAGRGALEAFFEDGAHDDFLWVAIDMSRLPEAGEAAE